MTCIEHSLPVVQCFLCWSSLLHEYQLMSNKTSYIPNITQAPPWSVPSRRKGPVPQHNLNSRHPLILKTIPQLPDLFPRRLLVPPHLRPRRLPRSINTHKPIIPNLHQTQPRQIPTPITLRVTRHSIIRLLYHFSTDGITSCETTQLGEELVAGYVVHPGCCHGFLEGSGVGFFGAGCCHSLDATEFCEGVDLVFLQGVDESFGRGLSWSASFMVDGLGYIH